MDYMFGKNRNTQELTISNRTIIRLIAFVIGTLLLVGFFERIAHPLTLIFMSLFLSLALNPAVTSVSKRLKSKSRTRATAIAYVCVVTVLVAFLSLILPPLISQTTDFLGDVPTTLRDLEENDGVIGDLIRDNNLEEQISQFANNWARDFSTSGTQAVSLASRVVSNLISIVTVMILTFMMLVEGPKWLHAFWVKYPKERRVRTKEVVYEMYLVVTNYVYGQVVVAAIGAGFAIATLFIMTTIFGVTTVNAIALGGVVFLFSLIPMFGASIAAIVVVLFSLFASVPLAIFMGVYFVVYQQIENATIQPYIQSKGNELTPLLVFIAALMGVGFGGILGAFIAIPVAGCLKILADDYLEGFEESGPEIITTPKKKN
jgi:predicted PurR-regulated permease PerM